MNTQDYEMNSAEPTSKLLQVDVAAISEVGKSRGNNEDCFGYDLEAGIYLVCDGMGGQAAGEVASRVAVDQMLSHYRDLRMTGATAEESFRQAIYRTNQAVWTMSKQHCELLGMGTTMVAACVDGNNILIGNVGDSRAYLVRDGVCRQVTQDHSFAAEGTWQRSAASDTSERKTVAMLPAWITRAVGVSLSVQPDLFQAELTEEDTVLLVSDGLTRYATPDAIAEAVRQTRSLPEACRQLVNIAELGGAEDNVTCLLFRLVRI